MFNVLGVDKQPREKYRDKKISLSHSISVNSQIKLSFSFQTVDRVARLNFPIDVAGEQALWGLVRDLFRPLAASEASQSSPGLPRSWLAIETNLTRDPSRELAHKIKYTLLGSTLMLLTVLCLALLRKVVLTFLCL